MVAPPPGGCFCKVMILQGLPSTITKKLFILKELRSFWGCFLVKSGFIGIAGLVLEPVEIVAFSHYQAPA
jgi:hypothetical protein